MNLTVKAVPEARQIERIVITVKPETRLSDARAFIAGHNLLVKVNGQFAGLCALWLLPCEPLMSGRLVWRPQYPKSIKGGDEITAELAWQGQGVDPSITGICDIEISTWSAVSAPTTPADSPH